MVLLTEAVIIGTAAIFGVLSGVARVYWQPFGQGGSGHAPNNLAAAARDYRVTLFQNGALENGIMAHIPADICHEIGHYDQNGRSDQSKELAAWAAGLVGGPPSFSAAGGCRDCALYDETARRVESCADLASSISEAKQAGGGNPTADDPPPEVSLWVVAPGKWFVFPTGELGRAVRVPRVASPHGPKRPIVVETISQSPRVFHLHNFVSAAESDKLVAHALANDDPILGLQRSTTGAEHKVSLNPVRTSENAFDSTSPTAKAVSRRAIELLGMEPYESEMIDGLQVLRYNVSKAYIPHHDYLEDNGSGHDYASELEGSNRFATILFYLSDVEEGGETLFTEGRPVDDGEVDRLDGVTPLGDSRLSWKRALKLMERGPLVNPGRRRNNGSLPDAAAVSAAERSSGEGGSPDRSPDRSPDPRLALFPSRVSWEREMVAQCEAGLVVRPKKAHAVLFYSQHPDGSFDRSSRHGGCPVIRGTKWAANLWIWNKIRLGYPRAPRKSGATAFDPAKGIGRDRFEKETSAAERAAASTAVRPAADSTSGQPTVTFLNEDPEGKAVLFWAGVKDGDEEVLMGDVPPGGDLKFNTFKGHRWVVRDASHSVILTTHVVDARPAQTILLEGPTVAAPIHSWGYRGRPPLPPGAKPPS